MHTIEVTESTRSAFLHYCEQWGKAFDESFIPDAKEVPHPDYPAYLLMDGERVAGATCLVRTAPFVADGKGRFMLLHTVTPLTEGYGLLLDALRPHLGGIRRIYGFIPEGESEVRRIWEGLGLQIERWAYLLAYRSPLTPEPALPAGFRFAPVGREDAGAMAATVELDNLNFAGQPGHTEYSVGALEKDLSGEDQLEGGLMLLYDGARPVGTVWVSRDEEPGCAFVSMLTVHADYRGRGLGRPVLRQGVQFARERGFGAIYLSVSAENEAAVRLYLGEGFVKERVLVCYQLRTGTL